MPDSEHRTVTNRDNASSDKDSRKIPEDCPELTEEVTQADIPVLDQPLSGNVDEGIIPTLEETITLSEKNAFSLDAATDPRALGP